MLTGCVFRRASLCASTPTSRDSVPWCIGMLHIGVGFVVHFSGKGFARTSMYKMSVEQGSTLFLYTNELMRNPKTHKLISFMENNKNEELQSRREFFKKAAKVALPVVGAVVMASLPQITNAAEAPMGCTAGCANYCLYACKGCQSTCSGQCYQSCLGSCSGSCSGSCKGSSHR